MFADMLTQLHRQIYRATKEQHINNNTSVLLSTSLSMTTPKSVSTQQKKETGPEDFDMQAEASICKNFVSNLFLLFILDNRNQSIIDLPGRCIYTSIMNREVTVPDHECKGNPRILYLLPYILSLEKTPSRKNRRFSHEYSMSKSNWVLAFTADVDYFGHLDVQNTHHPQKKQKSTVVDRKHWKKVKSRRGGFLQGFLCFDVRTRVSTSLVLLFPILNSTDNSHLGQMYIFFE